MRVLFILCFMFCMTANSQNVNNVWYFGDGNFLDFNADFNTPILEEHGIEIGTNTSTYCQEGASSMCDADGSLLFYSNGMTVWDLNYNEMPNGAGLNGTVTSAQTIILPKPGSTDIYYIFHMDFAASDPNPGLFYSEVDMSLNGGLGDVTLNKNVSLNSGPVSEQLTAITHCNGEDIWLISHSRLGNTFLAYLITDTGISNDPISTSIGIGHPVSQSGMSYMTHSKDGTKIALSGGDGNAFVNVFTFNNLTGSLCDPQLISFDDLSPGIYSVAFSADGTKLYATGYVVYQYDFNTDMEYIYPLVEPGAAMRGPNDKIYITSGCDYYDEFDMIMYEVRELHVIEEPNLAGVASNFQMAAYSTPREAGLGLPTCYYPLESESACDEMGALFEAEQTDVCAGDCIAINNASSGADIVSAQWVFDGGEPAQFTGTTPPQVCYDSQGVYTISLTLTDCAGLTSAFEQEVNVSDCPNVSVEFVASETVLCIGDCIDFTDISEIENVSDWAWTFEGADTPASNEQNPESICYSEAGEYTVILEVITNGEEYQTAIEGMVAVAPCLPPIANFSIPSGLCEETCIDFQDLSANEPTTWSWDISGATVNSSSSQNPTDICFNSSGEYFIELTVSNEFGSDVTSQTIEVLSSPFPLEGGSIDFCENATEVNLFDYLPNSAPTNGLWTFANSGMVIESGHISAAGLSQSTVMNYSHSNQYCSSTSEWTLDLAPLPVADLGLNQILCSDNNLLLTLPHSPGQTYLWTNGETDSSILLNMEDYLIDSNNDIGVTVSNICGSVEDYLRFTVLDCALQVYIPNAFTPDGDGLNENFRPIISGKGTILNYSFLIFDRWGGLVYSSDNPQKAWNGSNEDNGYYVQDGVYAYRIQLTWKAEGGDIKNYFNTGSVWVIR